MHGHGTAKRILSAATDNWISRGYLALCAALLIWEWLYAQSYSGPDATFFGVGTMLATLPTSLLTTFAGAAAVPALPSSWALPVLLVGIAVAAFVNATLLGLFLRALRRRVTAVQKKRRREAATV